jgi:hypothetical protein
MSQNAARPRITGVIAKQFWEAPTMTVVNTTKRRFSTIGFGIAGAVFAIVIVLIGAYAWQKHNAPSQASAADCRLAQSIVDQAQKLPNDKAADEKWLRDMHNLRMAQMKDGYLGAQIFAYETWAAVKASGGAAEGDLPTPKEFTHMVNEANSHCATKLTFPPITS